MGNVILNNITLIISMVCITGVLIWLYGAYYGYKLSSGIKKTLGYEYYLLTNKWPNVKANPDIRHAIEGSKELSTYSGKSNFAAKVFLLYIAVISIPIIGAIFYLRG